MQLFYLLNPSDCKLWHGLLLNVNPTQIARHGDFSNNNVELRGSAWEAMLHSVSSLEFCEAGRRTVLEEQRSTIERVGRLGGL
jgi:hypothetical protein